MANTSRINGFTVVGTNSGGNNGKVSLYYVASAADEILRGDVIKLGGTTDAYGVPTADLCGATDVPIGICVGILPNKYDPSGGMTTGSLVLDLPAATQIAASGAGYILVADDPHIEMEVEASNGTPTAADIGLNASHANGTRTAATVTSAAYLDFGTEATTSTLNFQILGMVRRVDNEMGASVRLRVRFNRHQYNSVGTTGI
jgi:hypothetical protein